jgi:serine/threonine-protein kinase RsbW
MLLMVPANGSRDRMLIEVRPTDGPDACVVQVTGDIDMMSAPALREKLDATLDSGCKNVVLDLSRVAYADSSALSLLIWLDRRLSPLDGRLMLAGANRDITRILELSGLVQIAHTVGTSPNVAAALEGLELAEKVDEPILTETITMPARTDALSTVREEVCKVIGRLRMADSSLFDIKVALGEALANAVRHGSPAGEEDTVTVRIEGYKDRVVLRVSDMGTGFDGSHEGDKDVYAAGGRGVLFMRALMDRVDFECAVSGGTTVTLVKHRVDGLGD